MSLFGPHHAGRQADVAGRPVVLAGVFPENVLVYKAGHGRRQSRGLANTRPGRSSDRLPAPGPKARPDSSPRPSASRRPELSTRWSGRWPGRRLAGAGDPLPYHRPPAPGKRSDRFQERPCAEVHAGRECRRAKYARDRTSYLGKATVIASRRQNGAKQLGAPIHDQGADIQQAANKQAKRHGRVKMPAGYLA